MKSHNNAIEPRITMSHSINLISMPFAATVIKIAGLTCYSAPDSRELRTWDLF